MAIKKIYIGSMGPFEYDDTELIDDPDGDFDGETKCAIRTNGDIKDIPGIPSGYSGDLTVVVGVRINNGVIEYLFRQFTFTNGVLTSEGTTSSWTATSPSWTTWTPTFGGAVLSGYTVARYTVINKVCFFQFTAESKNLSGTAGAIQVSLPTATIADTGNKAISCQGFDGAGWLSSFFVDVQPNSSYMSIFKDAITGQWTASETGVCIRATGFYEIA